MRNPLFRKTNPLIAAAASAVLLALPASSFATLFTASGTSGGDAISASANFVLSGTTLTITLTNTSTVVYQQTTNPKHTMDPAQVLTGLYFDIPGFSSISSSPSTRTAAGTLINGSGNTRDGWAYDSGLSGAPGGATQGIASAGFGLGGGHSNFNMSNGSMLDGYTYGIVGSGYVAGTKIDGDATGGIVVQDFATFTFTGVSSTLDTSQITNVSFQYGTALTEPNIPGTPVEPGPTTPEPASVVLMAMGGMGLAAFGYRRRKAAR
jgi:hypothetical protein